MTAVEGQGESDSVTHGARDVALLGVVSRLARFGGWSIEVPSGELHWTPEMYDMLGFVGRTADGYEPTMMLHEEQYRASVQEAVDRCMRDGVPLDMESVVITSSGEPLHVRLVGEAVRDEHGRIIRLQGGCADITEVVRERDRRIDAERTLRRSLDYVPDIVCFVDPSWRLTFANAATIAFVRTPADRLFSRPIWELFPDLAGSSLREAYVRAMESRESATGRAYLAQFSSWVEATAHPIEGGIAIFARDVTEDERRKAELAAVTERAVSLASMLEVSNEAVMARDLDDTVRFWNRGAERIYGWTKDEAIGRNVRELIFNDLEGFDAGKAQLMETGWWSGELAQRTRSGRPLIMNCRWQLLYDDHGVPTSLFAVNSDVTELRHQQELMNRTQRLESLGTMAGGIAHDLNNVLTPLMISVGLLKSPMTEDVRRELLDVMEGGIARGADMISQVLSFARGVEGEREQVSAAAIIDELRSLTLPVLPRSIEVVIDVEPVPPVMGDSTQILQVLVNLVTNARDAMPEGGVLRVSARAVRQDGGLPLSPALPTGEYVEFVVEDSGVGMSTQVQACMFDPFFTTKAVGRGTGLGLASSLAIARSHGGFLSARSRVGEGSRFALHVPVAGADAPVPGQTPPAGSSPRGSGQLVLVVDDEPAIRATVCHTLELHGYRTLQAGDGREAVEALEHAAGEVGVVLTDMVMPVMDGAATASYLAEHHADVVVVAATGVNESAAIDRVRAAGVRHFLAKPFTSDTLLRTIRDALREHPANRG